MIIIIIPRNLKMHVNNVSANDQKRYINQTTCIYIDTVLTGIFLQIAFFPAAHREAQPTHCVIDLVFKFYFAVFRELAVAELASYPGDGRI